MQLIPHFMKNQESEMKIAPGFFFASILAQNVGVRSHNFSMEFESAIDFYRAKVSLRTSVCSTYRASLDVGWGVQVKEPNITRAPGG